MLSIKATYKLGHCFGCLGYIFFLTILLQSTTDSFSNLLKLYFMLPARIKR